MAKEIHILICQNVTVLFKKCSEKMRISISFEVGFSLVSQ